MNQPLESAPTIYIAGASKEIPRAQDAMRGAVEVGFRILLDWTAAIAFEQSQGKQDHQLTMSERIAYATADLRASVQADVFWLLVPDNASVGAWIEYGAALASSRMHKGLFREQIVIASGIRPERGVIFTALADSMFEHDAEALRYLARIPVSRALELDKDVRQARGFEWSSPHPVPPATEQ